MRKVPYLVIGSGRLARHWQQYLSLLGLDFLIWSRKSNQREDLIRFTEQARTLILAISDDALVDFVTAQPFLDSGRLCHCSGSRYFETIYGAHPLMSFSLEPYTEKTYRDLTFIVDEPAARFKSLFPELPNQIIAIKPEQKPYYHALCVMSGNFTVILWQHVFNAMQQKLQIPAQVLKPYLAKIAENLTKNPAEAATGPLTRGDMQTIQANLQALENDEFLGIYEAFVKKHWGQ